ncbi:30S ribosomal protein S2 [Caldiplasma sukawensis]
MQEENLLISEEEYQKSGVHIGTQNKTADMVKYIYKIRSDGLYLLDVKQTDKMIRVAGKFLSRIRPDKILVAAQRQYAIRPVSKFTEVIGCKSIVGRFIPGTLTNYELPTFLEIDAIVVTDPMADTQVMKEAKSVGIPILAFCDANNKTDFVDLVIPSNNKGRRALALVYWLLAREILKNRGSIKSDDEFKYTIDDFEAQI